MVFISENHHCWGPGSAVRTSTLHGGLPSMLPMERLEELKETARKLCAPGPRSLRSLVILVKLQPPLVGFEHRIPHIL